MEIILEDYHYRCADGCCDEYGTTIIIGDKQIHAPFDTNAEFIEALIDALGVEATIVERFNDLDCTDNNFEDYMQNDDDEHIDEEFNQQTQSKLKDLFGDLFKQNNT